MANFLSNAQQKQSFNVLSFTPPKGWRQQQFDGGMQLSFTDKKTGDYAIALITKATASGATANENFTTDCDKLIKGSVTLCQRLFPYQLAVSRWENLRAGAGTQRIA